MRREGVSPAARRANEELLSPDFGRRGSHKQIALLVLRDGRIYAKLSTPAINRDQTPRRSGDHFVTMKRVGGCGRSTLRTRNTIPIDYQR